MKCAGILAKTAVVATCLAACGCASINISRVGKVMVDVENTNWLLFNFIPIASGNPQRPNENDCLFFCNTVKLENNIDLIDQAVQKCGAVGVKDLVSYTSDEYILFVLLKHHSMHTSAELVMPGDDAVQAGVQKVESRRIKEELNAGNPSTRILERVDAEPKPMDEPETGVKLLEF